MVSKFKNQLGFTLIEMLIVIVILGILAMIIVPQITVSTEDAKISTLQSNLSGMRSSVETYYAQHGSVYPGKKLETDGTTNASAAQAAIAFVAQLTKYSNAAGKIDNVKDGTFKYGPYIKGGDLPQNPFTNTKDVTCDLNTSIAVRVADVDPDKAWKFYPNTGVLIANDTDAHALY